MLLSDHLTLTVTMFGCWAFKMVLISLKEVIGKPSFSFSIFSLFKATISSENTKSYHMYEHVYVEYKQMSVRVSLYLSSCLLLYTQRHRFPLLFCLNTGILQHCGNPEKVTHSLNKEVCMLLSTLKPAEISWMCWWCWRWPEEQADI